MYTYRIHEIRFIDGTIFKPGSLTVIVGPNNSGKSQALKDILALATGSNEPRVVVSQINCALPSNIAELRAAYDVEKARNEQGFLTESYLSPNLHDLHTRSGGTEWPGHWQTNFHQHLSEFPQEFGPRLIAALDTEHRLTLLQECESAHDPTHEGTLLQALYRARKEAEDKLRDAIKAAFNIDARLDYSVPHRHCLRVGENLDAIPIDPRDQIHEFPKYEKMDTQGDGIRSFMATCAALITVKRPVILIDEPEAFLHPPQALRLGEFIAEHAGQGRQIIVATHSVDILRGMLGRTSDIDILRIDRIQKKASLSRLGPQDVKDIATDPLLSAARVLDGLFYSGVVVVEADSDAKFFQVASRRCRQSEDLYFVNADNKQTVSKVITSYRKTAVRSAGIVDIDILRERAEFATAIKAFDVKDQPHLLALRDEIANAVDKAPLDDDLRKSSAALKAITADLDTLLQTSSGDHAALSSYAIKMRADLKRIRESTSAWALVKQKGKLALSEPFASKFQEIYDACSKVGLFICPFGELEASLCDYGIPWTTQKRTWISDALKTLPTLTVDQTKEPWRMISHLHAYLRG